MSVHIPVWRIGADTPDYEAHDMSGKGAERTGGRWNRLGTPMLYAASSRALACLESVVNPLHPEIGSISSKKVRKWTYDLRLLHI